MPRNSFNSRPGDRSTWPLRRAVAPAAAIALSGLFPACQSEPPPVSTLAQQRSEELVLREGDGVKVSFPGTPELDPPPSAIRRDGKLTLPIVGDVEAAGLTPSELQNRLIKLYAKQLISDEVVVTVVSSSVYVFVDGAVQHPGKVEVDHPLSLLEAVMESGGFDYATANTSKITVIRQDPSTGKYSSIEVNLKPVIEGKKADAFYLSPGDVVHVPEKFSLF